MAICVHIYILTPTAGGPFILMQFNRSDNIKPTWLGPTKRTDSGTGGKSEHHQTCSNHCPQLTDYNYLSLRTHLCSTLDTEADKAFCSYSTFISSVFMNIQTHSICSVHDTLLQTTSTRQTYQRNGYLSPATTLHCSQLMTPNVAIIHFIIDVIHFISNEI